MREKPWLRMLGNWLAGYQGLNPSREEVAAAVYIRTVNVCLRALDGHPDELEAVTRALREYE